MNETQSNRGFSWNHKICMQGVNHSGSWDQIILGAQFQKWWLGGGSR